MSQFIKHNLLSIMVFITGACVLVVEVVATRILSPFYGNTIFTVSSVISVILAALSLGYYVGGRLSDRHPNLRWFFGLITISGVSLLFFHLLGIMLLPFLGKVLSISSGPLISSIFLFFFPAFLLGMLSPYAVKLQSVYFPQQGIGSVSGNIFFWSTLGSIIGSLLTGFVFIPYIGINEIMITNSIVLFLIGAIPLIIVSKKKHLKAIISLFVLLIIGSFFSYQLAQGDVLYTKDGLYEKISVHEGVFNGRPARFFQQDRSGSGAMFLDTTDPKDLVYDYTKYYSLYKVFNPEMKTALVIGGGAYSIPKAILAESPNITVDVSEIEPSLFNLAQQYFSTESSSRLHNYTEDGRQLLHTKDKEYDMIFSDVYYSLFSIPSHFTTQEFFTIAKSRLSQDGIFIANMIGDLSRQQPSFIMSEIKTFKSVFPNSYFFTVDAPGKTGAQNIMFVGYNSERIIDINLLETNTDDEIINNLPKKVLDLKRFDLSQYPILTDNYSPVEHLTSKVLDRTFNKRVGFDGAEILETIKQQLNYGPRYPTGSGHAPTQDFLIAEMNSLTSDVKVQTWQHIESGGETYQLKNIIARFNPEKKNRIILATHYDSLKTSFKDISNQQIPSPGANNSASGTAVLVEIARHFSNSSVLPNTGVDIVFFDAEEGDENQGGDFSKWKPLGSTYFAQHINDIYPNAKPTGAIVIDMVCKKDLKILKEPASFRNAPKLSEEFWKSAQHLNSSIFRNDFQDEMLDDHTPLNEIGIPSMLLIDYDYKYYATPKDTIDKCSAESVETIADSIWNYIFLQK